MRVFQAKRSWHSAEYCTLSYCCLFIVLQLQFKTKEGNLVDQTQVSRCSYMSQQMTQQNKRVNRILSFVCSRYLNILLKLVPQVLQLQDQLREAVQSGDMETSHGICRIAVSLGENHSRYPWCPCSVIRSDRSDISMVSVRYIRHLKSHREHKSALLCQSVQHLFVRFGQTCICAAKHQA